MSRVSVTGDVTPWWWASRWPLRHKDQNASLAVELLLGRLSSGGELALRSFQISDDGVSVTFDVNDVGATRIDGDLDELRFYLNEIVTSAPQQPLRAASVH